MNNLSKKKKLSKITSTFEGENTETQYKVLNLLFRIHLCFHCYKLVKKNFDVQ